MKKILSILLLTFLLCCAFALVSCDEADTPNGDANGDHTHTFGEWTTTTAATCTTEGVRTRACECGESETEKIATAHKWGKWSEASPATCNTAGSKTRACKVCVTTDSTAIPATGIHNCDQDNVCIDCGTGWDYTVTGINYGENTDGTCFVSSVDTNIPADIVLPYYHNEKKLTHIGNGVFRDRTDLKSITLPPTITSIDSYAFSGCSNLEAINIPTSVTAIGENAFSNCDKIIQTENGVLYVGTCTIGCYSSETKISLRDGTTCIGNSAFKWCFYLTSVTIPSSVTSIGSYAFEYCTNLTSITIPSSVTIIGDGMFYGCSSLTSIAIPSSVMHIYEDAFFGCSKLIQVEGGVSYVDKWVVDCDPNVTQVSLRTNTVGIGLRAFHGCHNLTSITIPSNVSNISAGAFSMMDYHPYSLQNVVFENPNGWWCADLFTDNNEISISSTDLADPSTALAYLSNIYCPYIWKRNG